MRNLVTSNLSRTRKAALIFFSGVVFGVCLGIGVGAIIGNSSSIYPPFSSSSQKEESVLWEELRTGSNLTTSTAPACPPIVTTLCQPKECPTCQACEFSPSPFMATHSRTQEKTIPMDSTASDPVDNGASSRQSESMLHHSLRERQRHLFPDSMTHFMVGMSRVDRQQFINTFDIGYAWDPDTPNTRDVLILYNSKQALPDDAIPTNETLPKLDVHDAIQNCHTVKTILLQPIWQQLNTITRQDAECLAIVPQWASYHVHKFQRSERQQDQEQVSTTTHHGNWTYRPAREVKEGVKFYDAAYSAAGNKFLVSYLQALDGALERLRPLAMNASVGNDGKPGPIVVLVTNFGQSNLLLNLVCSAKSRNVDMSRLLLFATDKETFEFAQILKMNVFYDSAIFESVPKAAGKDYGTKKYAYAMLAKVYCVHLPLLLGNDVLFLDVDIALYKDPLPFFTEQVLIGDYDMYFQHDGFHHPERFAPLAANTGVYYVRHNERTLHLFDQLVRTGDQILLAKSHQAVVTTLVNEHMSRTGLRVKILSEYQDLFPNGWALQTGRKIMQYMKAQYEPQLPILFHPNWRAKERKREAFISTHNWFLQEQCYVVEGDELAPKAAKDPQLLANCCLSQPLPAVSWKEWEEKRAAESKTKKKMMKKRIAK